MGLSPTPFSVKRKLLFVFRILDALEIALDQSEALLHCRHVRININNINCAITYICLIIVFLLVLTAACYRGIHKVGLIFKTVGTKFALIILLSNYNILFGFSKMPFDIIFCVCLFQY